LSSEEEVLARLGASETASAIRAKQISAESVTLALLGRLRRLGLRQLAAHHHRHWDEEAGKADRILASIRLDQRVLEEVRANEPLLGVPVIVAGGVWVKNAPCSLGVDVLAPAPCDADCVRRLRVAGAVPVPVSCAAAAEGGLWWAEGDGRGAGNANPYDQRRTSGGGLSGGLCALLCSPTTASLAVTAEPRGDGSAMLAAHFCGLFAFRPTPGG